nr:immunoglobulin heavy chain junction region [Macaca mulatta]MOY22876.1 immunoglobulin heavy chain junction region [Macaca mulatta]MOY22986.1 immunoglobulin heavy chain junction region [Macaca mulatta]MOY23115.1 immunoglobulin heavy chain junction region [Macaca mulatta]MOY23795.1 immunoglobulin heavy chain junction region [Macaca mulatta]
CVRKSPNYGSAYGLDRFDVW